MGTTQRKIETRQFKITNFSKRDDETGAPAKIQGYAAVFNSTTDIGGYFQESIAPGAFSRSIGQGDDIRALFDHDWANVLGRVSAHTLTLSEDEHGLKFELLLPDTTVGRDLAVSMERGDINQCSFGFVVNADAWDYSDSDYPKRTITDVDLYEVSVVALPAYEDTEASLVRSKGGDTKALIDHLKLRKQTLDLIQNSLNKEKG